MVTVFFTACETNNDIVPEKQAKKVYLTFTPLANVVLRASSDNLPEEYAIQNLSIFLTEVGSNTIVDSYPDIAFTPADPLPAGDTLNTKLITLSLDPTTVGQKDVYVIANHSSTALPAITTIDQLKTIQTPEATSTAGLSDTNGLPMYGTLLNANLGGTSASAPALVPLTRVCAKFRVTLTFMDATYAGTNNSNTFTMIDVPTYTFYAGNSAPPAALVTYPPTYLTQIDALQYQGVAYAYESTTMPSISINTTINGDPKTYNVTTNLPVSSRNSLYDIDVQVYKPVNISAAMRHAAGTDVLNCKVSIYSNNILLKEYFVGEE